MFDDDDFPAVEDDGMPAWADADADITALQESEDRCVVRLCDNGLERRARRRRDACVVLQSAVSGETVETRALAPKRRSSRRAVASNIVRG